MSDHRPLDAEKHLRSIRSMDDSAFFPQLASELVAGLRAARGDDEAEKSAMQRMLDAYNKHASEQSPQEDLTIPERFCDDPYQDGLSVIEYAAEGDEDVEFRWRELLADLCGY